MDYPRYQAQGWLIGSGHVEAGCKVVVGQRLKGSGMRWSAAGADAVCHLRALFKSEPGQWEAFYNSAPNPLVPTMRAQVEAALNSEEQQQFIAHLKPLVETNTGRYAQCLAYISAVK